MSFPWKDKLENICQELMNQLDHNEVSWRHSPPEKTIIGLSVLGGADFEGTREGTPACDLEGRCW